MDAVSSTPAIGMDLARFDRRTRVREAVAGDPVRAVPVAAPKPIARVKLGVSPVSVLLFMFMICGVLFVVFSYAQLSALNGTITRTAGELQTAAKEQKVLTAALESRIKLDEISEIAVRDFGFVKLDRRQIIYVDMSGKERAEVLTNVSLINKIRDGVSGIFG